MTQTVMLTRWPVGMEIQLQLEARCWHRFPAEAPWAAFCGQVTEEPYGKCQGHSDDPIMFGDLTIPEHWALMRKIMVAKFRLQVRLPYVNRARGELMLGSLQELRQTELAGLEELAKKLDQADEQGYCRLA